MHAVHIHTWYTYIHKGKTLVCRILKEFLRIPLLTWGGKQVLSGSQDLPPTQAGQQRTWPSLSLRGQRRLPLPERGSEVAGVSNFMKAASIAWLKEFWKLGTGTRSELSLSPSLSTGAGGTRLLSSRKCEYMIVGLSLTSLCRPALCCPSAHLSLEQFWTTRLLLLCQPSASAKWDRRQKVKV